MSICFSTRGKCASRTVVALGAVALFSMGAFGAGNVRSVDPNGNSTLQGTAPIDFSRTGISSVTFAPAGSGVPEGPTPCTQPAGNCQLPDQAGHGEGGTIGATSDIAAGFHVIEGIHNGTGAAATITEICWWGFYRDFDAAADCAIDVPNDNFTITLYASIPGCPTGAPDLSLFQTTLVGNAVNRTATGLTIGSHDEYAYSAQGLSIGPLANDTCYWIGIQNDTTPTPTPLCVWLWSTAPAGDNNSYQDGAADPINDFDLAMCLTIPLGDTTNCSLPPDALCIGATGACYEANGTPGCEDECCCTTVCQTPGLEFCCFSPWIQACADVALDLGCTALPPLPLCCVDPCEAPGQPVVNCQVFSPLNAFTSTGDPGAGADLFYTADDFSVVADGEITSLCFHGAYGTAAVADSFSVTVYDDDDGLPGNVIGTASEAGGSMTIIRMDTNTEIGPGVPVYQYTSAIDLGGGAGIPVTANTCYWLQIVNNIGDVETWFWEWAERGAIPDGNPAPLPREGNGRSLQDGVGDGLIEPEGWGFEDTITSNDLAFCMNLELATPACGFSDWGTETGPHDTVSFNGAATHLGWSSGDLDAGPGVDDNRRTVQAFTLPAIPVGPGLKWSIEHFLIEGFEPLTGELNESLNFEIFTRTALDVAPTPADSVFNSGEVAFTSPGAAGFGATEEVGIIGSDVVFLDPGDYWLTFWVSNSSGGAITANLAWFTNAPDGINNFCTSAMPQPAAGFEGCTPNDPGPNGDPPGTPAMLRARVYPGALPAAGFGAYTLDPTVLALDPGDPTQVAADLYNAAFRLRMRALVPPVLCPWDCQAEPDQNVGINDFLDLLGQWTQIDAPCDFGEGPPGVGVEDFLALLGNWGPCP